jgi:dolichol-phosphate mannosyltransferase
MNAPSVSLVIPAYNESEGVGHTAAAVRTLLDYLTKKHKVEVIFVNDGSKDDTRTLLEGEFKDDARVRVISHPVNQGLGAAIRTGLKAATGDVVITTDFDGTYPLNTIPQILARMQVDGSDVVTASPYHPNGRVEGVPAYRLMFSFGASLLYRMLVKWNIYCWTALYRAYRRPVIERISFESNDFLAGTELLVKALRAGYKVTEFPTTLHVRTYGQSSMRVMKVTMAHLKFQWRLLKESILHNDPALKVQQLKNAEL